MSAKFYSVLILFAILASCGTKKKEETNPHVQPAKPLTEQIQVAEKKIDINKPLVKNDILALIGLYEHYADSLPKDPKSPEYLLKSSDYYSALGMHSQKCHLYRKIIKNFPDFKDIDMVQYLYASSLDSDFDERKLAKTEYETYIQKYPNSIYVNDAKARLETIDNLTFTELQEKIISGELNKKEK